MDYPKFIVSNQKEESISIQRVKCTAGYVLIYLGKIHQSTLWFNFLTLLSFIFTEVKLVLLKLYLINSGHFYKLAAFYMVIIN